MNVVNPENKSPETIVQDKVDATLQHKNVDATLPQNGQITNQTEQENGQEVNEDPNWKAFREARKRDRAEREAAEKRALEKEAEVAALKAAMETAFSKQAPTPEAYQNYYGMNQGYYQNDNQNEDTEDQRIEKKVNILLEQREKKYRQEQEEYERREYPNKLARDYPDFKHVCSQENLDYLDYHYPELSRPLQRLPEGYDKWSDIYHAVKKFIPNHGSMKKESARADQNSNMPKSISSPQLSNPGEKSMEPWQETEKRRAENWARMQKTINRLG